MKIKKKVISVGLLLLALFALMMLDLLPGLKARAATAGDGSIGFYVRALLPENQMDKDLTYFDLRMAPGHQQTLEVEVVNEAGEDITVDIGVISASTNRNGVIDYKTPDIRDATLENPFSQLAQAENSALNVPAQGSALARITINMPEREYDGVVLGGLVFTRRDEAPQQDDDTASLQNLYSYVIGVKLSENDTVVDPAFELESVQAGLVNHQPALVHNIRNKNAAIAKGIDLRVVLRDAAGQVVGETERSGIDMAPNSTMPLAITPVPPAGNAENATETPDGAPLQPGDYTSEVTLAHGGETETFEQHFTIGRTEAEDINGQAVGAAAQQGGQISPTTLLMVLLAVAAAVILALFIIIMRLLRRREETKELNRLMRRRREQVRLQEKYGGRFG